MVKKNVFHWQVADTSFYAPIKENARENRNNLTESESAFWELAKSSKLGEKCRRQYVIGRYIVDFFFRKSMLIVEIDGAYHNSPEQEEMDKNRQAWLELMGYKVIRFTNEEILFDIENTMNIVKQNFKQ